MTNCGAILLIPALATLDVSLKRMMQYERPRYQGRHRITIFLDLGTFYESIEHESLIRDAKAGWLLHAYTGPWLLTCPEGVGPAIHATRGLVAGCPAAPILSKVALAQPCQKFLSMKAVVGTDLWVDDVSALAQFAAKNALLVSRELLKELKGAGHHPSLKKSCFIAGSPACEKELRRLRNDEDIQIHQVGKGLGVPTTGARRRSTAGQRARLQKLAQNISKTRFVTRSLKIGSGKARGRIFTASILSSGVCQGHGLSPSTRKKLRYQAAQINRHQKLGSVIAAIDMKKFMGDPVEEAVGQHWRSISKILAKEPSWIDRTWQVLWSRLSGPNRWSRVTGLLGALIASLRDFQLEAPECSFSRSGALPASSSRKSCPLRPTLGHQIQPSPFLTNLVWPPCPPWGRLAEG